MGLVCGGIFTGASLRRDAMFNLAYLNSLSFIVGIVTAMLVFFFRRLGNASRLLALFLVLSSCSAGILAFPSFMDGRTMDAFLRLSFCLLMAAAPLGVIVSCMVGRESHQRLLGERRIPTCFMLIAVPIGIFWIYSGSPSHNLQLPPGEGALGPAAYFCSLYLVLLSIIVLANLEQTLRSAQEYVRWEIKFLLLGIAGSFASVIYCASKVLLYPPRLGLISLNSMQIFPLVFLFSCPLILVSWKRSTGRWKVSVSPGLVYRSVTIVGVGIYLIVSSFAAWWVGHWNNSENSIEAALFLILLLVLALILLWTDFRHRVKHWIRRHLLAGNYDYRRYWLEANERIQSIDPPDVAGDAFADIVQKAVGAIDVSIWLRLANPTRLRLVGTRGEVSYPPGGEVSGVFERIVDLEKPTPVDSFGWGPSQEPMTTFLTLTKASVLVPLRSGNRMVGLLTVGPDRSGERYDWNALEFLGVLGRHAAGEFHKTDLLSTLVETKENEAFHAFSTFLLHDLKNFASTLSLIAKNASRYQDDLNFQRDAFQSVSDTAEKMKRLCNSLRAFSGAAADKRPNNLNQIVQRVADNFSGDLGERLVLDLAEIPLVPIDSEDTDRVLRNVLLNAHEAISQTGTVIVRTRNLGSQVEVSVEDNGCGMKAEFLQKELFVPFRTTKSEGLGIGLYQTKKIMEAHCGTILVESRPGHGTVVRLLFPLT